MAHQLDCPSCGADVKVKRGAVSAVCSYCGGSVIIPEELRGQPVYTRAATPPVKGCGSGITIAVGLAALLVAGIGALVFYLTAAATEEKSFNSMVNSVLSPGAVSPDLVFGGTGSGRGYFQDPSCIAADGAGRIFVGERESGRVQVFDENGIFIDQWTYAPRGEYYLMSMSSSRSGELYLCYDSEIFIHNGETGELQGNLCHPDGWGFEDVDVASDDRILASWYCNRDDLIMFNSHGGVDLLVRDAVSGLTGDSELSMTVAAGNTGELYVFGSFNSVILVYNSSGDFTDRFGDEMFTMPSGLDVDPQGRLWVSDFGDLLVFSQSGTLLNTIDPGVNVIDFVIDDRGRLWGLTIDDEVVMIDVSQL